MNLELILLDQVCVRQKQANLVPLISLKLQNLPILWMFYHSPIAGELLLTNSHNLLEIILIGQSLHGGQCLPSVPLLDPDVHNGVLDTITVSLVGISERIKSSEVLNFRHCIKVFWCGSYLTDDN